MSNPYAPIKDFMLHHYRHFNARTMVDAAEAWVAELERGHRMFLTLAGAMSTAEIGLSLAEMIRREKIHGISCTGANLEEDVYNLVAHDYYERVPNYRNLSDAEEQALLDRHLNRVTDTCIPEEEAIRRIERVILSGGGAKVTGFDAAFQERTGLPVEVMNPLARMVPNSKFDQEYLDDVAPTLGVSVGLAMRRVEI